MRVQDAVNTAEALELSRGELRCFREMDSATLVDRIGDTHVVERTGTSGAEYQVDVEVMWDGRPDGDVMVIGSVDDGRLRAFAPLTRTFIKSPRNEFVGE